MVGDSTVSTKRERKWKGAVGHSTMSGKGLVGDSTMPVKREGWG